VATAAGRSVSRPPPPLPRPPLLLRLLVVLRLLYSQLLIKN